VQCEAIVTLERLRTVRQLAERYPAFTEPSIRWLIFNAHHNGLDRAIVRVGKPGSRRPKLLIDEAVFAEVIVGRSTTVAGATEAAS
jgi:hypothetical protein